MYAHIVSFKIKEGEELTFVELQKFEENMDAKPAGLDHFHIFKDLNDSSIYHLIEYWKSKEDKDKLEKSSDYQYFQELRELAIEKKYNIHECEMLI